jgi:hypothetical protein
MTTLIGEDDEKRDIVFPLLKTTTPIYNDMTIIESTQLDSNNSHHHHQYGINKEIDKSVEISFDKNEFKPITISFYNINYIIGNERIKNKQFLQWQTKIFPFWKPIPIKQILTDVSGIFPPGMNAILGIY